MKSKIAVAVALFVVAGGSAIYAAQPAAWCPNLWRVLGLSFAAFGLYNFIRGLLLARPYRKQVRLQTWQLQADPPQSHRDVVVSIPASEHRRGSSPKFEYLRNGTIDRSLPLVTEVSPGGDISIYHAQNSFMPPWREFDIEIRG